MKKLELFTKPQRKKILKISAIISIISVVILLIPLLTCKGIYSCREQSESEKMNSLHEAEENNPSSSVIDIALEKVCNTKQERCFIWLLPLGIILAGLFGVYINSSEGIRNLLRFIFFTDFYMDLIMVSGILLIAAGIFMAFKLLTITSFS